MTEEELPILLRLDLEHEAVVLRVDLDPMSTGRADPPLLQLRIDGHTLDQENVAALQRAVGDTLEFTLDEDERQLDLCIDYGAKSITACFHSVQLKQGQYSTTDLRERGRLLASKLFNSLDKYWSLANKHATLVREIRAVLERQDQRCVRKQEHFAVTDPAASAAYKDQHRLLTQLISILEASR